MGNKAREERSVGTIVNLIGSDADRITQFMFLFHVLWSAPLQIIVSLAMIYTLGGMKGATFAGVAAVLFVTPIQVKIMMKFGAVIKEKMKASDARIKIVSEVLNGMRVIKYYCPS